MDEQPTRICPKCDSKMVIKQMRGVKWFKCVVCMYFLKYDGDSNDNPKPTNNINE